MNTIYIIEDDDTHIYGNNTFYYYNMKEPYMLDLEDNIHVKYFKSRNLFIVYKNSEICEIIYTNTCWSDDIISYKINNKNVISYYERYHGSRSLTIYYDEYECVKSYEFSGKIFGIVPKIGEKTLLRVEKFISDNEI